VTHPHQDLGVVAKPPELVALGPAIKPTFKIIKEFFGLGSQATHSFDISDVNSRDAVMQDVSEVAALMLLRLQGLYRCTRPDVPTTLDVLTGLVAPLIRDLADLSGFVAEEDAVAWRELKQFGDDMGEAVKICVSRLESASYGRVLFGEE